MGANRSAKAGEAARSVASNPYVRRLIEDEELRDNIREAFDAARDAFQRMSNGKGPAKALVDDKKVQRTCRTRPLRMMQAAPPEDPRQALAAAASASARRCWWRSWALS